MDINIESIMEEIRGEIRAKGYKKSDLSFSDISFEAERNMDISREFSWSVYQDELRSMETRWEVPLEPVFTSSNALVQFLKKVMKKLCRFFTVPMITMQNAFNASVVRANAQLRNYVAQNEEDKKKLEQRIQELERKISELEGERKK